MRQMGMDKKIEKKNWSKTKTLYLIGFVVFFVLAFFGFYAMNKKTYKVNASKISVKKVIEGDFQDVILIDGTVESINLVLVNTLEGGTVDEVFIEDGVMVEKNTPLVKLSNPAVELSYMNQETAIVEQINNLRNLKLSLEKDQRDLTESLIDSENSLADIERDYKVDSVLYTKDVIAKNDYIDRREAYKYLQNKRDFMNTNVKKSRADNEIQIRQIDNSIALMQRNLNLIHENLEKMLVRAPVTGMLSSFSPVIGESYRSNQTVAKIDVQSGFKIIGQVDEYYLSMVKPGQLAQFSFDGELIDLKVKKVLPEVINRRFEIELVFVNDPPKAITIGQSLQVRLELSKAQRSLLIPRGNYFQSSGGQYVFVINNEGEATKRYIKLGSQNPSYYQVLEGLNEGEEFISSSYEDFKNYESIKIN
ncbi:HlyD family efflux transporter periplasmic adaptor subunit [Yeosuana sp. MJ-SS3]|jgi:HlyD family secretion protein|uniref:HlyD family efflux transporter periplasmic adaptor subunit n=1 Tax=Gilvirhabdus luticola TaxID=3079858 RepID=A0ABU3U977_9FLAO|nr:HlyD family efflux transporter periplasmic adaptor subunit [Yeosuana sp. MJ-SS3]MDU8886940.1 HlyD family efflux transporter periplasmic adaptor subunit [Yeosuana sp. MJ-SS3]